MAKYFILACDGGGIRGYVTASVLQTLVSDPGIGDFLPRVSLRAGTSTGSFIALALARGVAVSEILRLYQQGSAQQLFTRNPAITGMVPDDREGLLERFEAELSKGWHWLARDYESLIHTQFTHDGVGRAARRDHDALAAPARDREHAGPRRHAEHTQRVDADGAVQPPPLVGRGDVRVGGRAVLRRRADLLPAVPPRQRAARLLR
jgi:hypothetical protein